MSFDDVRLALDGEKSLSRPIRSTGPKQTMRVVFITHYVELYGANRSMLDLVDGLQKLGVTIFVISPDNGDIVEALRARGIDVAVIPMALWLFKFPFENRKTSMTEKREVLSHLLRNMRSLSALAKQVRTWNVDVVISNSAAIPTGAMVAKRAGYPHIWCLREFCELHYPYRYDWGPRLSKRIISRSDATISVSNAIREHYFRGKRKDKWHVVYDGVVTKTQLHDLRQAAPKHENRSGAFVFVIVGIISPNKGQEDAIKALSFVTKTHPNARLLVVGGGDTTLLKQLAKQLGVLGNVEFLGFLADVLSVLLEADAALMCSRHEAFGRVTVEAMAAGLPVIGRASGGTVEIIEDGENGLLYDGRIEDLAKCMSKLIENRPLAKELGENARKTVAKRFTIEMCADRFYEIVRTVVKK